MSRRKWNLPGTPNRLRSHWTAGRRTAAAILLAGLTLVTVAQSRLSVASAVASADPVATAQPPTAHAVTSSFDVVVGADQSLDTAVVELSIKRPDLIPLSVSMT